MVLTGFDIAKIAKLGLFQKCIEKRAVNNKPRTSGYPLKEFILSE
jgi:hypothetical protein